MTHAPQYLIPDFASERFPVDRTLESFPLLCAYVCVKNGRVKPFYYLGELAVIVTTDEDRRLVARAAGRMFWLSRGAQHSEERRGPFSWAPHWTGEPRPAAETRELSDVSPSIDAFENLRPICSEYGLPFLRARDIVCLWKPKPRQSRRKRPDHYLPDSEIARIQILIGDHHGWSAGMRKGVLEIVLGNMHPREAAELAGENPHILGQNARRVVKELYPGASSPLP